MPAFRQEVGRISQDGRRWALAAWAKHLDLLERIVRADESTWTRSVTELPDGRQQLTRTSPTSKDRLAAHRELGRLGGVDAELERQGGGGLADIRTLRQALHDPAIRAWLEQSQPDVLQALRLLSAEPVEVAEEAEIIPQDDVTPSPTST